MEAIWLEDLPVEMLISTEQIKQFGWETMFRISENYLINVDSGIKIAKLEDRKKSI